jgi:hypothetical protein
MCCLEQFLDAIDDLRLFLRLNNDTNCGIEDLDMIIHPCHGAP